MKKTRKLKKKNLTELNMKEKTLRKKITLKTTLKSQEIGDNCHSCALAEI